MKWALLGGLFVLAVAGALMLGAPVAFSDLWGSVATQHVAYRIFLELRPPRVVAGALVGACLAASGVGVQSVFKNPLAEPYLLGMSAGGALGAAAAAVLRLPALGILQPAELPAFGGAIATALVVYRLGSGRGANLAGSRTNLLLTGIAVSAWLAALLSCLLYVSGRPELVQQVTFWLLGGLAQAEWRQDAGLALMLAAGMAMLLFSGRDVDAMQAGDAEATTLGVDVPRLHRRLLVAAALMTAAAVAVAGLIGFIGLLAPHLVRRLFGVQTRVLVPAAALGGATLLVVCDAAARSAVPDVELPVGIVTAIVGVPLFLLIARGGDLV